MDVLFKNIRFIFLGTITVLKHRQTMAKVVRKSRSNARSLRLLPSVPSVPSAPSVPPLLLIDINDDCLTEIFKYLDVVSLINVCKCCKRFRNIVLDQVMPFYTVNTTEAYQKNLSVQRLFEILGQSIEKLHVCTTDFVPSDRSRSRFGELIHLITQHSKPGLLKKFVLTCRADPDRNGEYMPSIARPYFGNIHTLEFILPHYFKWPQLLDQFIDCFPKENLRVLKIENISRTSYWLNVAIMPKLRELHLVMNALGMNDYLSLDRDLQNLISYIRAKPSLNVFNYIGINSDVILNEVSQHIPNIERLGNVIGLFITKNNGDNDDQNNGRNYIHGKWNYLNEFENLKVLSLTSYAPDFTNAGGIFRILANHNTLEKLELVFEIGKEWHRVPITTGDLERLKSLTSLSLVFRSNPCSENFSHQLFGCLSGLTSCKFSGSSTILHAQIITPIAYARKLRILDIECKITKFSKPLYKRMIKTRLHAIQNMNEAVPLEIFLDSAMVKKGIDDLGEDYKPSIVALQPKPV